MKYDDEDGDEDDNCVDDDDCDEDDDGNDNDFYDYHDDKDARRSNPWPMIKMISEMIKKKCVLRTKVHSGPQCAVSYGVG